MRLLSLDELARRFRLLVRRLLERLLRLEFSLSTRSKGEGFFCQRGLEKVFLLYQEHTLAAFASFFSCSIEVFSYFSTCLFSFFSSLFNRFWRLLRRYENRG